MDNLETNRRVVTRILTGPSYSHPDANQLSLLQQGLVALGYASLDKEIADARKHTAYFNAITGGFGPGTAEAVMHFLEEEKNLPIALRLNSYTIDKLKKEGFGEPLSILQQKASAAGHDPDNAAGRTIGSLLAQPYAMSRAEIEQLQKELQKDGFYPKNLKTDGIFGANTAEAVVKYAQKHNLLPLSPNLLEFRNPAKEGRYDVENAYKNLPAYNKHVRNLIQTVREDLQKDVPDWTNRSPAVLELQLLLRTGGYTKGYILPDGVYGNDTAKAVENFESGEANSLTEEWESKEKASPTGTRLAAAQRDTCNAPSPVGTTDPGPG